MGRFTTIIVVGLLLAGSVSASDVDVKFDGQVRARAEYDDRTFNPEYYLGDVNYLRIRAGIRAVIEKNTEVYVQIQDSRLFGDRIDGAYSSGTLNNTDNIDLHQGYIKVRRLWHDRLSGKVGRFEFNLGNQRLFGAVGWSNVGRAWEGITFAYTTESVEVLPFFLKRQELQNPEKNRDFEIAGVNVTARKLGYEFLLVYENDGNGTFVQQVPSGGFRFVDNLDRATASLYVNRPLGGQFDIISNLAYQFGEQRFGSNELNISAFLIAVELGHTFDSKTFRRVAAGVDYTSGWDYSYDGKFTAFDNLYYTGHKFRGAMDYFTGMVYEGLIDLYATANLQLAPDWQAGATVHYFRTAEDLRILQDSTKELGGEIDLAIATTSVPGIKLEGGLSVFVANDVFAARVAGFDSESGVSYDPGLWLYGMATADF